MWTRVRDIVAGAVRDFAAAWRILAITDLAYKAVAFAVLTPATALFLRWLLSRTGTRVVADADIARFFVTTPRRRRRAPPRRRGPRRDHRPRARRA